MQDLAEGLEFESAAFLRDRIRALTQVQGRQDINVESLGDADIIAAHQAGGHTSIQVFFFRGGQNWGNRAYFPSHDRQLGIEDVLAAFIGQFYDNKPIPPCILASHVPSDHDLLVEALSTHAGRKIELATPQRGDKRKLVEHALVNAREALARKLAESSTQQKLLAGLADAFGLDAPPQRIEVYDNSHIQGSHPVGAMIVAGPEGFLKNAYRKFNIRGETEPSPIPLGDPDPLPGGEREECRRRRRNRCGDRRGDADRRGRAAGGDDYAMMREVLGRRFARALKDDPERERGTWPDLILLDGGAGQLPRRSG